jgi:hypothetical protein
VRLDGGNTRERDVHYTSAPFDAQPQTIVVLDDEERLGIVEAVDVCENERVCRIMTTGGNSRFETKRRFSAASELPVRRAHRGAARAPGIPHTDLEVPALLERFARQPLRRDRLLQRLETRERGLRPLGVSRRP